jgi:hypothetical protein
MARVRSPGYPNTSLAEAIEYARKIHQQDRQNPVSRDVAAKHMGFSGLTGTSDRALSALMHYGLAEKVAKGEIRVSAIALQILHPNSLGEKRSALRAAAFEPELFRELRARYMGEPPSLSALSSFLTRENFAEAAIGPAAKAYLETCQYLQREGAYESDAAGDGDDLESGSTQTSEEPKATQVTQSNTPVGSPPSLPQRAAISDMATNDMNLTVKGSLVHIEALLDLDGLAELEGKIAALRTLLTPRPKKPAAVSPQSQDSVGPSDLEGN